MNLQRLTIKSQETLQSAREIASSYGNQLIEPIHILAAMLQDAEGIIPPMLMKIGANVQYMKLKVNEEIERLPKISGANVANQYLSQPSGRMIETAMAEAEKMGDEYVSVEHMLLAISDDAISPAGRLLKDQGVTRDAILAALKTIRGSARVTDQNPEEKYQALQRYGRNLNDAARKGKVDPVIGRDDEIRRVMQVLMRRTKNNPVLIGEPGVGKTAIAEGIAIRIVEGDVPEALRSKARACAVSSKSA
jgi:ATP-dependent Clp protease ATP-binding subunit ClpB